MAEKVRLIQSREVVHKGCVERQMFAVYAIPAHLRVPEGFIELEAAKYRLAPEIVCPGRDGFCGSYEFRVRFQDRMDRNGVARDLVLACRICGHEIVESIFKGGGDA